MKKKVRKRSATQTDAGGFRPAERAIYRFHDGRAWVQADPIRVQRELLCDPDLSLDFKLAASATPEAWAAVGRIVAAVRRAFRLAPFEAGGLAEVECVELLADFGRYVQDLQKKTGFWPTSATPMAPESSDASSPTPSGPAWSSTGNGSPVEGVSPSASV